MKHHLVIPLLLAVVVLPNAASAQPVFAWSPAGSHLIGGGFGDTVPFWAASATYQQVHDHSEMVQLGGGNAIVIKGIAFRASRTAYWKGRSMDVQINIGGTGVTSQNISTTFSTNLGGNPVRVVGDSQTPFQTLNFYSFTGNGDPNLAGTRCRLVLPACPRSSCSCSTLSWTRVCPEASASRTWRSSRRRRAGSGTSRGCTARRV
jgi:hypothetical protein